LQRSYWALDGVLKPLLLFGSAVCVPAYFEGRYIRVSFFDALADIFDALADIT
jgi:hypothetical protein